MSDMVPTGSNERDNEICPVCGYKAFEHYRSADSDINVLICRVKINGTWTRVDNGQ
jgi:hypothetical protein